MTTITERPDVVGGVVSRANGLEIADELSFNEWRRLGERLLETSDRALWSLGDWRLYGERFTKDYHDALQALDESSRLALVAARVARSFPAERRRGQLTFEMHELVASLEEHEQERWLDEVERQGWKRRQLQLALGDASERQPVAALSVRAVGPVYALCVQAAERRGMEPKQWALDVLERAARAELEAAAA